MIGQTQEKRGLPLPAEDYAAAVLRPALVEVVYEWVRERVAWLRTPHSPAAAQRRGLKAPPPRVSITYVCLPTPL